MWYVVWARTGIKVPFIRLFKACPWSQHWTTVVLSSRGGPKALWVMPEWRATWHDVRPIQSVIWNFSNLTHTVESHWLTKMQSDLGFEMSFLALAFSNTLESVYWHKQYRTCVSYERGIISEHDITLYLENWNIFPLTLFTYFRLVRHASLDPEFYYM